MTSMRPPVVAPNGVVAAAHPLAAVAGLRMLLDGGNAIDAAVATAATLNVVEPYMSGIGGDGYMMVTLADGTRKGLDFVGRASKQARRELYTAEPEKMRYGVLAPLVPGNLGGWLTALELHGTMDRATVFAPAIDYARNGFPLTPKNATFIEPNLAQMDDAGKLIIAPHGRPPRPAERIVQADLARTYEKVVEGGLEVFYRGEIAGAITSDLEQRGGLLSMEDFAGFRAEWVEPISVPYEGYDVATLPPPCCGVQYLETLGLIEGLDAPHGSPDHLHTLIEAVKIAIADRAHYLGRDDVPVKGLLGKDYLASRRKEIDRKQARPSRGDRWVTREDPAAIRAGDLTALSHEQTTSFSIVDKWGNAVSVTQSLGHGFGSGVCVEGTGIFLNSFSFWFDLDPGSPNVVAPGRKIAMCMAPCHARRDGRLALAIGTPGGYGILQTTAQMIVNRLHYGMDTQAAIEAPRFRAVVPHGEDMAYFDPSTPPTSSVGVAIEGRYPAETYAELERRGHRLDRLQDYTPAVGGGQGVAIDLESGARIGGADPRRDGVAVGH